jgi:hypothetical protein
MSAALAQRNTLAMVSFRAQVLPWTIALDDELRFRRISRRILITCAIVCIALPWLPVLQPDRSQVQEVPLPLAKLLLENQVPPPVKSVAIAPPIEREAATRAPSGVAKNKEVPVPEARVPLPNKPPGELDAARRKAAGVGLLAMKDTLAELHGAPVAVQLKEDIKPGPGVGTGVGAGVGAGTGLGLPTRALITSNATGGSGGINTASYSRDTGGGGLAGRSTTLVEGVIGGGGGGGAGGGGARGRGDGKGSGIGGGGAGPGGAVQRGNSGKASRSIEDIKIVFERNKGAIYAIYNRALRADPSLQGKVVLKLTIAPGGGVVDCRIESSELRQPDLEGKLLARIRQFDFGAKDVDQMVVTWPVDFLPS